MSDRLEVVAGRADEGLRLDVVLARLDEVGSRAAAQRLIRSGRVRVDSVARRASHRVAAGERVVVTPAAAQEAAEPTAAVEYGVAFEDEHLIVVDKPAGLVVHPAPAHREGTLSQALAARGAAGGEPWRPGVVHRLDRGTSGLMVVAKSERVHRALQEGIRRRAVEREYLALVDGRPPSRTGTIDAPIGRDRSLRTAMSTRTDRPREAITHFELREALPASSLLMVRLETGRTHQVRAHLAAIGHPVLGDPDYGGPAAGRVGLGRQFLHSARLAFDHPAGGARVDVRSELPDDLRRALEAARGERA